MEANQLDEVGPLPRKSQVGGGQLMLALVIAAAILVAGFVAFRIYRHRTPASSQSTSSAVSSEDTAQIDQSLNEVDNDLQNADAGLNDQPDSSLNNP